jgi:hypothetical protein
VPWIYNGLIGSPRRGRTLKELLNERLLQLARRLKVHGDQKTGVIGGDLVEAGRLSAQPPNTVYWSALRTWKILSPTVHTSRDALQQIEARTIRGIRDDEGGVFDAEGEQDVFSLPLSPPAGWNDRDGALTFALSSDERACLREKLGVVPRKDLTRSLLANLVADQAAFPWTADGSLPLELDKYADADDRRALAVARDAAHLAAVGRMAYGALVEYLREAEGIARTGKFAEQLEGCFAKHGAAASRCNLEEIKRFVPKIPDSVSRVLRDTQAFVQAGVATSFPELLAAYRQAEVERKTLRRARLGNIGHSRDRRAEWRPERHKAPPLHYRWDVVHVMLQDLKGNPK